MVPKGWIKAPVQDFGHVSAGRQRSPNFTKGTLRPYLRVANVFENYIDTTDVNEMMFTESEYQRYKLEIGDILLNEGQSTELVGRPAMYVGYPENCCFQNTLVRFKADNDKLDASYALQRFLLCLYDGTFQAISKKTTSIAHLGVSRFAELNLLWPPLVEQQKITQILSTWDQAISVTEKLLENSQQQQKALMQQLLTGKKRLLDESGVQFDGEWKLVKVSNLLKVRKEKQVPTAEVPLFSLTIENGITPKSDRYNREFLVKNTEEKKYKVVRPKDIVYNPANLRWGAINFSRLNHSVVVSPIYEVLYVSEKDKVSLEFIAQKLMTNDQINRFAAMVEGTLVERMAVKIEPFLATKLTIPTSLKEQQAIAIVLSKADQQIELLQKKLDCLKQEKKALMQQLLTGKKRVKVAA